MDGLPESALALAAQQAKGEGHEAATPEQGPWLFTLDFPSFFPVMTHAKNRRVGRQARRPAPRRQCRCPFLPFALPSSHLLSTPCRSLREEMYRANISRASAGDIDNTPLIERVLTLRQEKAALLGYANFAEVSMASKVRFLRVSGVV